MKQCLFILGILLVSLIGANAQSVVFEDDFESYEAATNLTDKGYVIWAGGATVQVEDGTANKFADCNPSENSFYLRREVTLEVGKSYTFEVSTKSPAEKNHRVVAKVGDRNVQSELIKHAEWAKTTLNFTIGAGETNVILWVYSYPVSAVHVDNFKLTDDSGTPTNINEVAEFSVRMFPNPTSGKLHIKHNSRILSLNVYDISGKLIDVKNGINRKEYTMDMSSYQKGSYFFTLFDAQGKSHTQKVLVK